MVHWVKKVVEAVSKKGGIFMFLRAQFSSQISSLTDFLVTIVLANVFGVFYVYSTFAGSVCGGIVNCIVNYKWTFKSKDCKVKYVAIKYILVWVGSILLNTSGTYLLTELMGHSDWLRDMMGAMFENIFIISKILVSLLVGFLWNYNMQRLFVYRNRDIKGVFIRKKDKGENNSNGSDEEGIDM